MIIRKSVIAAAALLFIPAVGFAQSSQPPRTENNETICSATGSGMDPRCVGETNAGTVTDMTTDREQRAIQRGAPTGASGVPLERVPQGR